MSFESALAFLLAEEGGPCEGIPEGNSATNDPSDPGGLTKFGICQRSYPTLDIRALTQADAAAIYRRDYWDRCRCGEFPPPLGLALFDSAVNQGPATAIKLLQRALGVAADGIAGPATLAAARTADPAAALAAFLAERALRYALTTSFARFGRGWMRRLFRCQQAAVRAL